MNVLIDDAGKAVLCDFGLSRIKADTTSRTAIHTPSESTVVGSRNWMSPERLTGGLPRKPADIYAFGMTLYEVSIFTFRSDLKRDSLADIHK
jgi:serine/threonine protein kinase